MHRVLFALVIATGSALFGTQPSRPAHFDVLIRNGRVMDGAGNPWVRADVGIRGDRLEAIGRLDRATATRVIDAADRIVAPGFIDVHTHAAQGLARPQLKQGQPLLAQGVTTIVGNPDGGGPIDLAAQRKTLENGGLGPNVALLIGHGSVRSEVMGSANRQPTAEELDRMRSLVRRGMEQGAFGLSSGLFYTPGSFAKTEEVIELAKVAGEFGGLYSSHVRDEGDYNVGVVASVQEVIRIAEEARIVGIATHMKALGPDSWGLSHLLTRRIDEARARGVQVFADQYAYEASSTNLRAALLPGGVALPSNTDPANRKAVETVVRENLRRRGGPASIQIAVYSPDRSLEGRTLAQVAEARGTDPVTAALDMLARGNASIVSFNMSEEDIEQIMRQPYTMTSSDGGLMLPTEGKPHPRDYGAFARKLARYVRERHTVPLEFALRSMTSLPALVFGMRDRGGLREGMAADVVVFDPAIIQDKATYADPHQLAQGMSYVLVNGTLVVDDGKFTEARPGRVLTRTH